MRPWQADVEIDEGLVRGLLSDQFPELDASSARLLGEGWDNSVWLVEERLAFRFPRRAVAAELVERELRVLPLLAPLLPVAIPVPVFVGRPGRGYSLGFFGAEVLPGSEVAECELTGLERERIGARLGRFLRLLHDPATRDTVDPNRLLPVDPNRRGDMTMRVGRAREQLVELERLGVWKRPSEADRVLRDAVELPPPTDPPVLVHGDLHVRHALVVHGRLSGVIDWGDVCLADPAIDLQLVWSLLPLGGREAFLEEYGMVDDEQLLRSRVVALFLGAMLAVYARHEGRRSLEFEAIAGLERTLVEWRGVR
jgi:aminoglycoside phosphotransferase (APT) family kinase protein